MIGIKHFRIFTRESKPIPFIINAYSMNLSEKIKRQKKIYKFSCCENNSNCLIDFNKYFRNKF